MTLRTLRTLRLAGALSVALSAALIPSAAFAQQPAASPGRSAGRDLTLAIGEQVVIPAGDIRQFSEGTPGIVDVRTSNDGRMIVVGQRAGSTTLLLIHAGGNQENLQITVFARRPEAVQAEIENLLEGYTGVQIRRVGARLYLEGGVASEAQQRRVQQIATLYPGQVESLVAIDPTIVERRINVRLDLYFVELSTNASRRVGLSWPAFIGGSAQDWRLDSSYNLIAPLGGQSVPPGIQFARATLSNQPLPRLDIAANGGYARVLRQATLITANGNEARYRNGGELNFRLVAGNGGASLAQIEFGTTVKVTPRFDPQSSRIDLRVEADISDPVQTGTELPGRNISQLNTLVNLQLGQSIIMSGFRSRTQTNGSSGLPGLRSIPILGYLFGTEANDETEREGMIFIVPTVIEGISRSAQDRVAEALRQYEQFSGDMDDVRLYEATGAQYR
jgi:pilus assembly protein CpaC